MVKAIVRAHRWRDMLESGHYVTVRDLAKAEAINESYLGLILRLTLLFPALIEANRIRLESAFGADIRMTQPKALI